MFSPFSFSMESSTHRLLSFGTELVKSGNDVSIFLPRFDRHSSFQFKKVETFNGVRIIQPYQTNLKSIELSTIPYVFTSFLKSIPESIDVIHVLKPLPITCTSYVLKYVKRVPLVQDMDDLDHNVMMIEKHSAARTKVVKYCETILPSYSNHITTCSSSLRQIYINMGFKSTKITWLPNGVKTSDFSNANSIKNSLKKDLALKDKVIVYLGSLNNSAQVYPLIKAMELLVKTCKDVSCLIIGDGIARPYLQKTVENLHLQDYIKFHTRIAYEHVPVYLSVCDVGFACTPPPFTSTGGALKVFIYMAASLPVVVNPVGDLPKYIDFGKAGVVSKLDPSSLSSSLLDLLSDERERRKKSTYAKVYVQDHYDWAILTKKLLKIYESLSG